MLTHGSLFSGIGGFELGARMSDILTLWNCEIVPENRKVLKRHFPDTLQFVDVCKASFLPNVDIISGGFPCQDISISNVANKSLFVNGKSVGINGKRSGLWSEMWRICGEVRPQYLIIENSPMLVVRGLSRVLSELTQIGYMCEWQCLCASQFGYNHRRERFYGIAYPLQKRCLHYPKVFKEPKEMLLKQPSRQNPLSVPIKRFNGHSDFTTVRMDDGFSSELDIASIEGYGNAIIPEIAHYLFECIKIHYNHTSPK